MPTLLFLPFIPNFLNKERKLGITRLKSLSSQNLSYDLLALDFVSTVDALTSCTGARNLELGSCTHATVLKSGSHTNVFVNNSLLDMYMKCGCMEEATKLFDHMPKRTIASWTSKISGYCHMD